jgi:hypothetical protein
LFPGREPLVIGLRKNKSEERSLVAKKSASLARDDKVAALLMVRSCEMYLSKTFL